MRKFLVFTALAAMLPAPAFALTLEQAMAEVAGYYCAGSTCTTSTSGTRDETIAGSETRVVGRKSPAQGMVIEPGRSTVCFFGNGWPMINVSPITCQPNSLLLDGGGVIKRSFPTSTTVTIETRTTITKELIYNGPETDRAHAWTVNTSTSTVDCPCN